jgi:hypothetical protein
MRNWARQRQTGPGPSAIVWQRLPAGQPSFGAPCLHGMPHSSNFGPAGPATP